MVLADITGANPNVMYEIGLAHRAGTPTFLVCDDAKKDRVPFDLKVERILFYKSGLRGLSDLNQHLSEQLTSFLQTLRNTRPT